MLMSSGVDMIGNTMRILEVIEGECLRFHEEMTEN